jgi:hypothetical protein
MGDNPIFSSERMLRKSRGGGRGRSGREPQEAWHKDELIGGIPPTVK